MVIANTGQLLEKTFFNFQTSFYAPLSNQTCFMYVSYLESAELAIKALVTSQISLKSGFFVHFSTFQVGNIHATRLIWRKGIKIRFRKPLSLHLKFTSQSEIGLKFKFFVFRLVTSFRTSIKCPNDIFISQFLFYKKIEIRNVIV